MHEFSKRIAILGGTFDPIHYGHLIVAEEVRERFNIDKVLFIPSGLPPHKNVMKVTEPEHRYNMVCKAIQENPYFEVSRIEIERSGYTYTIDTLVQLRQLYGNQTKIFFIIGADVVHDLVSWKNFESVFEMCEFITVLRPGFDKIKYEKRIDQLKLDYKAMIHGVELPLIEISSTAVREKIRAGKSIKYLVPEEVQEYILTNKLYVQE